MITIAIRVEGGPELAARLKRIKEEQVPKVWRLALREGARFMADEVKRRAPRGPRVGGAVRWERVGTKYPRLADSIEIGSIKGPLSAPAVAIYARAYWARFLELGTKHWPRRMRSKPNKRTGKMYRRASAAHRAHPFMRPAFDATAAGTVTIVGESLAKRLTQIEVKSV
jgi:HK97 gp10 family phage protein